MTPSYRTELPDYKAPFPREFAIIGHPDRAGRAQETWKQQSYDQRSRSATGIHSSSGTASEELHVPDALQTGTVRIRVLTPHLFNVTLWVTLHGIAAVTYKGISDGAVYQRQKAAEGD